MLAHLQANNAHNKVVYAQPTWALLNAPIAKPKYNSYTVIGKYKYFITN